ncbi:MAG: amino acid ABC transporter permease [Ruminococcaceae bacterium]|nr:amino acid ABC transporter permease [Oscillospiraceae bacterium]
MSFWQVTQLLLEGFGQTLLLFALTLVLALPLGLLVSFGAMSKFKPLMAATRTLIWVIRGTPLMLQLFVVFYVPGFIFGTPIFHGTQGRFLAALVAFVINYACYLAEIFRGGILAIPQGQYEAGQVLGMTKTEIFFRVILMQVVRRILPPTANEIITLVKDTSLARVIMVMEIFCVNEVSILSRGIIWPLFYIGAFFLLFVGVLTILFGWLEKKLSYYKV